MSSQDHEILPFYEVFYIHSLMFNSTSAVQSLISLTGILEELGKNPGQRPTGMKDDDVLNHLQNVILQAGAISKYCFPPSTSARAKARAETIKTALGVTDASPLRNRDLRNSLEHFDERLDEYLASGVFGRFFPQYLGSEPTRDSVPSHIFRAYYIDNDTFELLGVRYKFGPIASEVMRVHKELERCFNDGGRLQARK